MHAEAHNSQPLSRVETGTVPGRHRQVLLSRNEIEAEYSWPTRRWLELAAMSGEGPPMIRISRRMVRYQRGALEDWLISRTVSSTSEEVSDVGEAA